MIRSGHQLGNVYQTSLDTTCREVTMSDVNATGTSRYVHWLKWLPDDPVILLELKHIVYKGILFKCMGSPQTNHILNPIVMETYFSVESVIKEIRDSLFKYYEGKVHVRYVKPNLQYLPAAS